MGGPQTVNQGANTANSIIAGIIAVQDDAIVAAIVAQVPFLAIPGINYLFKQLVSWIGGYEQKMFAQLVTGWIIDIQVNGEQAAAYQAANSLLNVINSNGADNAINSQASKDFDAAYEKLVNNDGSATNIPNP